MISGKILGKIWENLGRIGTEKGAKIVLSNDWQRTVMRTPKKYRGFCLLDSKDRLAGCLGLLETFIKRTFYC